jgi:hypothetical protein
VHVHTYSIVVVSSRNHTKVSQEEFDYFNMTGIACCSGNTIVVGIEEAALV